ncbi:DUF3558 domain-containing protein [Actinopolyspora mortivallis]|uniref:DUF3558 domain-containing protein n=1 Tax=Actinopolyspora mortivallis TaxID=33906 RepID=UPI002158FB3D|nr:DUF3558 domain-containing protein [Actinopolyspora mortivallis]
MGVTACSPSGGADEAGRTSAAKPSEEVLAGVDPCDILPDAELESFGVSTTGEPTNRPPWAPGCHYRGDSVTVSVRKETRDTVASAEQKDVWAKFERTEVNGRAAATAIVKGATQARMCSALFDAGRGMIQIQATEVRPPDTVDECAKALEFAEMVEPKVPEPA